MCTNLNLFKNYSKNDLEQMVTLMTNIKEFSKSRNVTFFELEDFILDKNSIKNSSKRKLLENFVLENKEILTNLIETNMFNNFYNCILEGQTREFSKLVSLN